MDEKSEKTRSFDEITLAITILTGLSFILFKIADYFNNNTIGFSDIVQSLVSTFVSGLIIELVLISSFLILKGYLLFAASGEQRKISITNAIFHSFIIYFVFIGVISIFLLFLIIMSTPTLIESPYYIYIFIAYIILTILASLRVIGFKMDDLKKSVGVIKENRKRSDLIIAEIIIGTIFLISIISPVYLLGGSYSIDVFPQSEIKDNILTFTIKETGITSGRNFINLYKLDDKTVFKDIDSIIINYTQETSSINKTMLGKKHEGTWYLTLNTSNLSYGNYMLHAEVTLNTLISLGVFKKHDDKLFYIPPKSANYSFNSI